NLGQPLVRSLELLLTAADAAEPAATEAGNRARPHRPAPVPVAFLTGHPVVAGKTNRVDHDVVFFGALGDVFQRLVAAGEVQRPIDAVGEHHHHAPPLFDHHP